MALRLIYSKKFGIAINDIAIKVPSLYSRSIYRNLIRKIRDTIKLLTDHPLIGMVEPGTEHLNPEIRRIVIQPYFKLIYSIIDETIYLRDLWDTRQDPNNLIGRL